jgi:hypothetical protein
LKGCKSLKNKKSGGWRIGRRMVTEGNDSHLEAVKVEDRILKPLERSNLCSQTALTFS